jgi:hypothetical protein
MRAWAEAVMAMQPVVVMTGRVSENVIDFASNMVADALLRYFMDGGARAGELLRLQSPAALRAIKASAYDEVKTDERAGSFAVPMGAVLAFAMKPLS